MLQVSIYPLLFCSEAGPLTRTDVCFVSRDSSDARTLTVQTSGFGRPSNNTVENCVGACRDAGYPFAGVGFAQECCTCRLFDDLSSPDRASLLKGVTIVSIQIQTAGRQMNSIAGWLARGIALSFVVQLTVSSFIPSMGSSVWACGSHGKVERQWLFACDAPSHICGSPIYCTELFVPQPVLYCAAYNNRRGHYTRSYCYLPVTTRR
jgi:hypothetical protein